MTRKSILNKLFRGIRRFIKPLLIILLITLLFNFFTYRLVWKESMRALEKSSDYYQENIDGRLADLTLFSHSLLSYGPATEIAGISKADLDSDAYERTVTQLSRYIYEFCLSNNMVEDCVFYYPQTDLIVCRVGNLTSRQYCAINNPHVLLTQEDRDAWFLPRFDHHQSGFFTVYNNDTNTTDFYFIRSNSNNSSLKDASCIILMKFNPMTIQKLLGSLAALMDQDYVAMITLENHIYTETGQIFSSDFNENLEQYRRSGHIVHSIHSHFSNMDLYLVQSISNVESYVRTLAMIQFIGLILAVLFALILLFVNYSNMLKDINPILEKVGLQESNKDLYSEITAKLNHYYESNLQNIRTIGQQQLKLNDFCLKNTLLLPNRSLNEIINDFSFLDISFENDTYIVFVHPRENGQFDAQDDQLVQFLAEFDSDECLPIWCRFDNGDIFLCNYDSSPSGRLALNGFREALSSILGGNLRGGNHQLHMLDDALDECRTMYKMVTNTPINPAWPSDELIPQAVDALRSGRNDAVLALLPAIENLFTNSSEGNMNLCLRYSFLSELYQLPQFKSDTSVLDQIYAELASSNWLKPLEDYLRAGQSDKSAKPTRSVVSRAAHIIATEYSNHNIGLSTIANRLGVSQPYLSRAFKQAYGMNISYYLNKTRIDHAKELMLQGNGNLNTIALRVGFLSDMNLIRVFKKIENETPGAYRRNSADSENTPGDGESGEE